MLSAIAAVVAVLGVGIAYIAFRRRPAFLEALVRSPASLALQHFWETDWGFDWLYDRALVRPFLWIARIDQSDFIDSFYTGLAVAEPSRLSATQRIRDRPRTPVRGRDHGGLHCSHRDPGVRMILLWLILTPLIGGLLAGFSGRRNSALPRWLSLACLAIDLVLVLVAVGDTLRRCGHPQRDMACSDRLALDPATRHPASSRPGWPQPVADPPYPRARRHVGDRFLERDHRTRGLLPFQSDVDLGGRHRRLSGARSLPLLLLLGIDARSHVFLDRRLGA